ncbi:peptide ABC transporter substrate-binding protein [Ureibacillus sp. FSL K6-8385]|uniref:Peptide ABC transporter substrate-binding protein n=1 Tax=Ureibacillus terrenus TaxID=118246 RepID=A0A540V5K3_9BACL|nr:peptide ABC transporter substrate-binding protein [Ureibacillus terrenus]MED3764292.1 peptide ABC transporter substrate-binding protein [Ureibacillus terrenus]TQE92022.1 peptide ABC transporter substrate-binding protein [Ureibacillus terrenus]
MKKKFWLLLAALLTLTLVLAACGGGNKDEGKKSSGKKEINLVIPSEPPSLHPGLATDTTSSAILDNVFEGLMTRKDGEIVNALAEDYTISDDQLTYTFKLRDAKWSNGDPVTAHDFEYAWKWVLNPENASEYASILYPIKNAEAYNKGEAKADDVGVKAEDDKTLVVTLDQPTPYFLELTAFKTYYPVNKNVAEKNPKWYTEAGEDYVTNGPFLLDSWNHNKDITLKKNPDYWDADNVALEKVNITMVESEQTATTMFDNGEIDFLGSPFQTVSLDAIDQYKKEGILNIEDYAAIYWYKFNTTDEILKNKNIRKALALAIDRQGLIDNVTKGEQKPALGMVPAAIKGFEKDRGYFKDNDVEEAKKALEQGMKELGISKPEDINIKISFNTSEAHSAIAQFIQENWRKNLGINATLDNSEWQVYLDKLSNLDYQVGRLGWIADYNDAYSFLEQFDSADNGNNDTGWENPEYTKLLREANKQTDEEKRLELLKQAEAIIMEEFPVAPIYYYTSLYVAKDHVKNMKPDNLGNIYLKYVEVE